MWTVWNKTSKINGMSAKEFFNRNKHLQNQSTIYLKYVDNKVVEVEGKEILANVYNIDISLDDETFIEEYERIISEEQTDTSEE